jgi:hypothetical protein
VLQPAEGCDHFISIKHLNQPVKQALLVVWPRLKIFLEDTLGIADGLKHRLLIGHDVISGRSEILPRYVLAVGIMFNWVSQLSHSLEARQTPAANKAAHPAR